MIDHIRAIAVFAKVAETGSFRGAARVLGLSPSVVSQHITNLETRLSTALIYRSTRSFSLTPHGEQLLHFAQKMVLAAEEGLTAFSDISTELVGVIRMSMPQLMGNQVIIRELTAFTNQHPGVALRISFSDLQSNMIRDGLDLVFRISGSLKDSSLKVTKISEISRCLVASPSYIAKHKKLTEPADLENWNFIRFDALPDEVHLSHPKKGSVTVLGEDHISVDNSKALGEFAIAGAGIATMLEFAVSEDIKAGKLVKLLPDWKLEQPSLYALWPPNSPRHSLARKLVDHLDEHLSLL